MEASFYYLPRNLKLIGLGFNLHIVGVSIFRGSYWFFKSLSLVKIATPGGNS